VSVVSRDTKRPFAKTGSGQKQGTSNSVRTTRGFSSSFFFSSCFSFLRRVLRRSAVAMGGLRLALEKLRRPPRPHQQAEV
jgi:hypothetical protein